MRDELKGTEVVLIVEDEPSVRAPISRLLKSLGYFVLEASHGEDAIGVMQEYGAPIHIVITDINMPEMNGRELIELLRDWYPKLRVLFISGVAENLSGPNYLAGSEFLAKPFTLEKLAERVRSLLDTEWTTSGDRAP
jgi:two-component system, cell cycle sensor histidine kinase and response regulator CckA